MSQATGQSESATNLGSEILSEARRQFAESANTIEHCLGQLTDRQIWWRPQENMNSVGNLVLHLTGNIRQRILADIGGEPFERDRFGEFSERRLIPRDDLFRQFREILGKVETALAVMPAERLNERIAYVVTAGTMEGTVMALILRTLTHLSGHTQEILLMTRLQLGDQYKFKHPAGVPPTMRGASS
jgi:Protein of unknown function (DUF1572)